MKLSSVILAAIIMTIAVSAFAAEEMDGFRGIPWGSDVNEIRNTARLVEGNRGGMPGVEAFSRPDDNLNFGGVKSEGITYNFYQGKLVSVSIEFRGFDRFEKLLDYCRKRFGPATASAVLRLEQYVDFDSPKTGAMLLYQLSQQTTNYGRLYLYSKEYLK